WIPSSSPGRGGRVVADTERAISGYRWRRSVETVPLPTAVGPARTVRRVRGWSAKLGHEFLDLVRPESADSAGFGDADVGHDLAGFDLPDPRQAFQELGHAELRDRVVLLGEGDHFGDRAALVFQALLHIGSGSASRCGLLKSSRSLLWG